MKKKHKGLIIAIGVIIGFIVLLMSYYMVFRNYDIKSENDELVIYVKEEIRQDFTESLEETTNKVSSTIKDLSVKFSIKNNIMSIIILIIGVILYIITKRRSEHYVKREKE